MKQKIEGGKTGKYTSEWIVARNTIKNRLKRALCMLKGHTPAVDEYYDWTYERGTFIAGDKIWCPKCRLFFTSKTK